MVANSGCASDRSEVVIAPLKEPTAEVTKLPKNEVRLEGQKEASQMIRLMESLEDHDDVQNVYANFDIPDELMDNIA